ncbi:hypothetical protein [Pseudoalteromonas prydzensis]|uniref:hypothetical protein n=1 Tax=Pseudoalteromonas prydzensis TaxID=182141 RepID=UPI0024BD1561|nr:hypothetical protein [Pseudoalteromonas prydzensis]
MKTKANIYLFILTILLSSNNTMASQIKTELLSCNGCTATRMKLTAEHIPLYGFDKKELHIFDETNLVYRKYDIYKPEWNGSEPPKKISNAYEVPIDLDVNAAFIELATVRANALNSLYNKTYTVDSLGDISDWEAYRQLSVVNLKIYQPSTQSTSSNNCTATPVSDSAKTAHDYINNSSNRRELFNKLQTNIVTSDPAGFIALFIVKHTAFINVMEQSSIGIVSTVGSTLGVLNPNNFSLATVDGGRMKGYMDFDNDTFRITSAYDGDCNDIPLEQTEAVGRYRFSYRGGAERMGNLFDSWGGKNNYDWSPSCGAYQSVCTGISGTELTCYTICTQYQ